MTQTSYPFDNADTTEDQFSKLFNRSQKPGTTFMGVASQPDQTSSGSLCVFGDSSGMQVKVRSGFAVVRGFGFNSDATETLAISASSSNPRIDLVILELNTSSNNITLKVVTGSPSATPVAPSLTQGDTGLYQMEIGRVSIPALATTIAAGNVSDTRPCLPVGVGVWTTAQRPSAPVQGQMGWNTSTTLFEVYTGSAWQEVVPQNIPATRITSGTLDAGRIPTINLMYGGVSSAGLGVYEVPVSDGSGNFLGVKYPMIDKTGKVNNPTVGTAWTTTGPSIDTTGNNEFCIVMGTCIIDAAAADRTITMRLQDGSTLLEEYTTFVPNGKTATIAAQFVRNTAGSNTTFKMNYKSSSSTTTSIDGYLTVLGIG